MPTGAILKPMDSHNPTPSDSEASDDFARTTRWIPLAIPLAGALILALTALVWAAVLA
jgi:hypothetical protein